MRRVVRYKKTRFPFFTNSSLLFKKIEMHFDLILKQITDI